MPPHKREPGKPLATVKLLWIVPAPSAVYSATLAGLDLIARAGLGAPVRQLKKGWKTFTDHVNHQPDGWCILDPSWIAWGTRAPCWHQPEPHLGSQQSRAKRRWL